MEVSSERKAGLWKARTDLKMSEFHCKKPQDNTLPTLMILKNMNQLQNHQLLDSDREVRLLEPGELTTKGRTLYKDRWDTWQSRYLPQKRSQLKLPGLLEGQMWPTMKAYNTSEPQTQGDPHSQVLFHEGPRKAGVKQRK